VIREGQEAPCEVLLDQVREAGLMEGRQARLERVQPLGLDLDSGDLVPPRRGATGRDESDVPLSDDSDSQFDSPSAIPARSNTRCIQETAKPAGGTSPRGSYRVRSQNESG
jgi:hypothetical protein